jgi:hypothetical protein
MQFFFFFSVPGLELRAYTLSHSTSSFCVRYFWDRVLITICPGWLRAVIFLISASHVARIIGVSHWHLAKQFLILCTSHDTMLAFFLFPAKFQVLFVFIFAVLGFELMASHLLGKHFTTWTTPSTLFTVGYFQDSVLWTICPTGFEL